MHLVTRIVPLLLLAGAAGLDAQRGPSIARLALPAPSGVTVAGQAPQITVTWQPVAGAADYTVLRSTDPSQPPAPVSAPTAVTSFVDQAASAGAVYYYSVVARSPSGQTATSAAVRFDPPALIAKDVNLAGRFATRAPPPPPQPPPPAGAVTSVSDTVIPPGGTTLTTLRGTNLAGVTGIYFGYGAPGSVDNPKFAPSYVAPAGDEVRFTAPVGCKSAGPVVLEQHGGVGAPAPFRLNCVGKPEIDLVVRVAHGRIDIHGLKDVNWVTQITDLARGGTPMQFTRAGNRFSVIIPPYTSQQFPNGQAVLQPNLISPYGSAATAPITIPLPPLVTSAAGEMHSPGQVTPLAAGDLMEIHGFGFTQNTVVTIDRHSVPVQQGWTMNLIKVYVPSFALGRWEVTTAGGTASGQFIPATGGTVLTSVTPADAPVGATITITGLNLTRAQGVCFTKAAGAPVPSAPVIQLFIGDPIAQLPAQWTNASITTTVPQYAASGPIGLYFRGTCQMGGATLLVQ